MKTAELLNKLSKKYPAPMYAFLGQVRNHTGYSGSDGTRTADAMSLGLWPSRGCYLHGFELKVSRPDWLHEFKKPEKAEPITKYCDMFSLVVADISIVDIEEVSKNWGIMAIKNGVLKTIREAPLLKPKPLTREFLAGFLRRFTEEKDNLYTPTVEVDKIIEEKVEAQIQSRIYASNRTAEEYDKLVANIKKFEEASGVNLEELKWGWNTPEKIGDAVKVIMDGRHKRLGKELKWALDSLSRMSKEIKTEYESLPESLKLEE